MRPSTTKCLSCGVVIKQKPKGGIRKRCQDCVCKERQERLISFLIKATPENERVGGY